MKEMKQLKSPDIEKYIQLLLKYNIQVTCTA